MPLPSRLGFSCLLGLMTGIGSVTWADDRLLEQDLQETYYVRFKRSCPGAPPCSYSGDQAHVMCGDQRPPEECGAPEGKFECAAIERMKPLEVRMGYRRYKMSEVPVAVTAELERVGGERDLRNQATLDIAEVYFDGCRRNAAIRAEILSATHADGARLKADTPARAPAPAPLPRPQPSAPAPEGEAEAEGLPAPKEREIRFDGKRAKAAAPRPVPSQAQLPAFTPPKRQLPSPAPTPSVKSSPRPSSTPGATPSLAPSGTPRPSPSPEPAAPDFLL